MVNVIKTILALLVIISAMGIGVKAYAQPITPKENIPSDIPADVEKQIERLYSPDPVERAYGAIELSIIGERARDAVTFLAGILHDATPLGWSYSGIPVFSASTSVGSEAAKALGEIKDPRAVDPLLVMIRHRDWYARSSAAEALGKIKDPRAIEPLITALKDENANVRKETAEALEKLNWAQISQEQHITYLIAVQKWSELIKIGKPAVELLIAALRDQNWDIRFGALKSLIDVTGQNFGDDPAKWQKWWEKNKSK